MIRSITSKSNPTLKSRAKLTVRKYRQRAGLFLAEGLRLVEEAFAVGDISEVFFSDDILRNERGQRLLDRLDASGLSLYYCSDGLLDQLSDTESCQGIVAVVRCPPYSWSSINSPERAFLVVADQVQDPGNLGSLVRTSAAAGADGVIMLPGTVDIFNSKVVRASMGSLFRIPVLNASSEQLVEFCRNQAIRLIAADIDSETCYYQADLTGPLAVVIGNEGRGISPALASLVDFSIRIPLHKGVESLNASVAAGIILYEIERQRASRML